MRKKEPQSEYLTKEQMAYFMDKFKDDSPNSLKNQADHIRERIRRGYGTRYQLNKLRCICDIGLGKLSSGPFNGTTDELKSYFWITLERYGLML